jgi:transglutaminase-like putative cysteine protease
MSFLKDNKIFIFVIYINILFIVTLAKISYKIENFDYVFVSLLVLTGVLLCWFFQSVLKKTALKISFLLILLIGGAVYYFSHIDYANSLVKLYLIDNFNLINSLVAESSPTAFELYKPIFILVLPLLVFIITLLTSKGAPNTILIVILAMIITLWYLGYTDEVKKYLFHYVFITLLTYCINVFVKKVKKLSRSGIKVGIKITSIVVYTLISSLIIAGISNILPQSYTGRYGSELQGRFYNKFGNTAANGEQKGKKYKYDLSFSGYGSSSSKLGGPITLNHLIAFRVNSDKTYYLRGTIKDYYDGFSWNQSEKKYTQKNKNEDSMLQDKFSKSYADSSREIMIHPEELNSSTIFTPMLSYNVNIDADYVYYDESSTVISSGIIEKPYSVYFYNLNDRGMRIINSGAGGFQNLREVGGIYYAEFYKKYLQIPDNISTRVYDLVNSLTKDKRSNAQKVQAIRDYLNKKYPYSLKVSQIPEGQEFLDYFLFTEQKGYCTYFATAETIMCRIAGIPARYVEGFNMAEEKDDNGLYVVRNENAHAWTEVLYMENTNTGIWYTVDAVPNAVDAIHKEEEQTKIDLENTPIEESVPNINSPKKPDEESKEEAAGSISGFVLPPIVLRALYAAAAVIFINVVAVLVLKRRKTLMIKSKSVVPLYKYSLDRLSTIGYKQSQFVSDMEFINNMREELSGKVKEAADLAYREYYGGKEPVEFNKTEYYKFIEAQVRKRQTYLEYFLKKYYFSKKISLIKRKVVLLYKRII